MLFVESLTPTRVSDDSVFSRRERRSVLRSTNLSRIEWTEKLNSWFEWKFHVGRLPSLAKFWYLSSALLGWSPYSRAQPKSLINHNPHKTATWSSILQLEYCRKRVKVSIFLRPEEKFSIRIWFAFSESISWIFSTESEIVCSHFFRWQNSLKLSIYARVALCHRQFACWWWTIRLLSIFHFTFSFRE